MIIILGTMFRNLKLRHLNLKIYVLWNLLLIYFLLTKIKRQPRVKQNAAITDNPIRLSFVHWSIFSKLLYSVEASATIFEKYFV